jgi:hypothetical protein
VSHSVSLPAGTVFGITTANKAEQGNLTFNFEVELTGEEHAKLSSALNPMLRLGKRDMYKLVERNYIQLDRLADFYVQLFGKVGTGHGILPIEAAAGVMAASIDWLNSSRLFLDHELTWLNRHFGKASVQLAEFKRACSISFDASSAYRFLYELRNYATHCGVPLSRVALQRPSAEDRGNGLQQRIMFLLDRDDLLSRHNWGKHVTPDLKAMPETFELLPLIHQAMPCFDAIMEVINKIDVQEAALASQVFVPYMERLTTLDGYPCLLSMTPQYQVSPKPIPIDLLKELVQVDLDGDVLAPFRLAPGPPPPLPSPPSPYYRQRLGRGATILATWLSENGATEGFHRAARTIVEQDGGAEPLVTGVAMIAANALMMAASAMGTEPTAILGFLGSCVEERSVPEV